MIVTHCNPVRACSNVLSWAEALDGTVTIVTSLPGLEPGSEGRREGRSKGRSQGARTTPTQRPGNYNPMPRNHRLFCNTVIHRNTPYADVDKCRECLGMLDMSFLYWTRGTGAAEK